MHDSDSFRFVVRTSAFAALSLLWLGSLPQDQAFASGLFIPPRFSGAAKATPEKPTAEPKNMPEASDSPTENPPCAGEQCSPSPRAATSTGVRVRPQTMNPRAPAPSAHPREKREGSERHQQAD